MRATAEEDELGFGGDDEPWCWYSACCDAEDDLAVVLVGRFLVLPKNCDEDDREGDEPCCVVVITSA